ncbi:MFS transporter [Nocardia sp. NBC_01499]|uniref:MFS transporter n=1 Tax=Nocardia sp. NBC_01499 TaxID=2903597 RepID=UPI00386AA030
MQLGRSFGWLWSAYAVSAFGTQIAFGAFPLIALRVLHAQAFAVSALEAVSLAVATIIALPLGPWVEHRNKRPVMITMDLVRFVAMASLPAAYLLGLLSYGQLLLVAIISVTANIAFTAASGAYLKVLVSGDQLIVANARFEGTGWVAISTGPPLGGALIGVFGPLVTVIADAVSYLLSALGVLRIRGRDTAAPRETSTRLRGRDLLDGWRFIRQDLVLRRLFLNSIATSGLIMAAVPLLSVLLLGRYHVPAWQYGLAFGIPSLFGFLGARLSPRLVSRFGRHRVMIVTGVLRACFPIGLAFTRPGLSGVVTVIIVEALLITCMGIFNPIYATERLLRTPAHRAARVLTAWSISGNATKAALIALWGILATLTSPLEAIALSGVLLLATPFLLPWNPEGFGQVAERVQSMHPPAIEHVPAGEHVTEPDQPMHVPAIEPTRSSPASIR